MKFSLIHIVVKSLGSSGEEGSGFTLSLFTVMCRDVGVVMDLQ